MDVMELKKQTFDSEVFSAQPESLGGNQGEGSLGRIEVDVDVRQVDSSSETDGSQGLPIKHVLLSDPSDPVVFRKNPGKDQCIP
jgi:hypothetical protein